jgi:hypothetical protein
MAAILQYRTDNDIKNKWNAMQRKKERQRLERAAITAVRSTLASVDDASGPSVYLNTTKNDAQCES